MVLSLGRIGLFIGGRGIGNVVAQIITATTAPSMSALTAAQTPADGYSPGTYASTAGTIASAAASYTVNGVSQAGNFDLAGGEVVAAFVLVTDSVGNARTFSAGSVTVAIAEATPATSFSPAFSPAFA